MKRIAILLALPVLLILVWAVADSTGGEARARVKVETDDVRGLRNELVRKLAEAGVPVRAETGAGTGDHSTTLTFELPVAGVEDALAILHANATVVEKTVDLEVAFSDVKSVESGLDTLDACLNRLQQHVESSAITAARSSVAECRAQLDRTLARVDANPDLAEPVRLELRIERRGTNNLALVAILLAVLVVLGVLGVRLLRAPHREEVIDVRAERAHPLNDDELFGRGT